MHAHSERALVLDGRAASFVLQGVTTQLLGEQSSAGPIQGKADRRWLSADEERDHQTLPNWTTLGGYFELLEEQGIATNVASFVGSGQVRACVMGYEDRPPTESELEQMKRLVDEAMEQGAVGLSSGLSYVPNIFAETEELIALAKVVADYGGFYGIHLRETGEEPLRGLQEAIRIAREAKIPVEIMHLNSSARENYDEFARTSTRLVNTVSTSPLTSTPTSGGWGDCEDDFQHGRKKAASRSCSSDCETRQCVGASVGNSEAATHHGGRE